MSAWALTPVGEALQGVRHGRPPVYVQGLQRRLAESQAESAALREGIAMLRAYLALDKFAGLNGWASVADVLLRLDEAESAAVDAVMAAGEGAA